MNWTSAEFGRRIGHSRSAVNRWRKGETVYPGEIMLSMLVAFANGTLGFDLNEFYDRLYEWLDTDPDYAHIYWYYKQLYLNREAWKQLRAEAEADYA